MITLLQQKEHINLEIQPLPRTDLPPSIVAKWSRPIEQNYEDLRPFKGASSTSSLLWPFLCAADLHIYELELNLRGAAMFVGLFIGPAGDFAYPRTARVTLTRLTMPDPPAQPNIEIMQGRLKKSQHILGQENRPSDHLGAYAKSLGFPTSLDLTPEIIQSSSTCICYACERYGNRRPHVLIYDLPVASRCSILEFPDLSGVVCHVCKHGQVRGMAKAMCGLPVLNPAQWSPLFLSNFKNRVGFAPNNSNRSLDGRIPGRDRR